MKVKVAELLKLRAAIARGICSPISPVRGFMVGKLLYILKTYSLVFVEVVIKMLEVQRKFRAWSKIFQKDRSPIRKLFPSSKIFLPRASKDNVRETTSRDELFDSTPITFSMSPAETTLILMDNYE
jgi:hypothetical protein